VRFELAQHSKWIGAPQGLAGPARGRALLKKGTCHWRRVAV
jgi:hypothetical protein